MLKIWPYRTPGLPDDLFIRGGVPMTKEEVRAITLAKARLAPSQIIWDIGAGTGSLSVEAALLASGGSVYAVERLAEGIGLIEQNRAAFSLDNLFVVQGEAPAALISLPDPDRVLIGGSGGKTAEIIEVVASRLKPGGRVVVNAVTLETAAEALGALKRFFDQAEAVQVSIARTMRAGNKHLLKSLNPVTVISAEKGES
jgi:precorrin-6Y C5,15-methyltransferase (decarboxylating) CbiT subunit